MAKALFLIARYFRRIAVSLEHIEALYRLDLRQHGIWEPDPSVIDEVEVTYGVKERDPLEME